MNQKQKLVLDEIHKRTLLMESLDKESRKALLNWLSSVERLVYGTRFGNFTATFNLLRNHENEKRN